MSGETAFAFRSGATELAAILHTGQPRAPRGVLIIVGGPQYRAGSHRQFVLLARSLAARGIPVMRFDYRGMGDAGGELADFREVDSDIRSAVDVFLQRQPGMEEVVLWGLCDAASAALFYGWKDARVSGMVLLNPWVRTETGQSRAYLRHYYLQRLFSPAFWRKLAAGQLRWTTSLRALAGHLVRTRSSAGTEPAADSLNALPLPQGMAEGLARFRRPVLLVLSENDLTAAEFRDTMTASPRWQALVAEPGVKQVDVHDADHTFSRREWRDEVARQTGDWVLGLQGNERG